ncbi:amino acid transporter [Lithospermum erythrorhizon]|uniref:Amino acid transporter n=1 Tax=Lithospermum erythrorhizon TaxID=34254 RepID=A0AAV3QQN8_LITER
MSTYRPTSLPSDDSDQSKSSTGGGNLTYYTGIGYVVVGGKGFVEGVKQFEKGDTIKLKVNMVLNGSGHSGRVWGNRAGVIGLMYAGLESGMVAVRDVANSVVDGLGTGTLYRAASGTRLKVCCCGRGHWEARWVVDGVREAGVETIHSDMKKVEFSWLVSTEEAVRLAEGIGFPVMIKEELKEWDQCLLMLGGIEGVGSVSVNARRCKSSRIWKYYDLKDYTSMYLDKDGEDRGINIYRKCEFQQQIFSLKARNDASGRRESDQKPQRPSPKIQHINQIKSSLTR